MKNIITTLKTSGLSVLTVASLVAFTTTSSRVWADSISHVPGSACQAYDEGALSSGKLLRTTYGITNNSNQTINVYCPVDTSNIGNGWLKVSVRAFSDNYNDYGYVSNDLLVLKNLTCYLAKNYSGRTYTRIRWYPGYPGNTGVARTYRSSSNPVVVKCSLRPEQRIESIRAQ